MKSSRDVLAADVWKMSESEGAGGDDEKMRVSIEEIKKGKRKKKPFNLSNLKLDG